MKAFVICLSKIDSSISTAERTLEEARKFGLEVELFEGSYGDETQILFEQQGRSLHPYGIKGIVDFNNEKTVGKSSMPGVKGCFYSHYRLWEKCVELNEPIIVLEDDVVFSRGFTPVEWDEVLIVCFGNRTKSESTWHYLDSPSGPPKAVDWHRTSMPGTPGYAIKPGAAKKLVETYKKTFLPSDNAMNQNVIKIQIHNYMMGKALVGEDGKKSLVRTRYWSKEKK